MFTYVPELYTFFIIGKCHSVFSFPDTNSEDWGRTPKKWLASLMKTWTGPICEHATVLPRAGSMHSRPSLANTLEGSSRVCWPRTLSSYHGSRPCTQDDHRKYNMANAIKTKYNEREEKEKSEKNYWTHLLGPWTYIYRLGHWTQVKQLAYSYQVCRGHCEPRSI